VFSSFFSSVSLVADFLVEFNPGPSG